MTESHENMKKNFRQFDKAGIIYVMEEAAKSGFTYDNPDWCNLGQGAAEAGELIGAGERILDIKTNEVTQGYAPVAGRRKLRENVAQVYNSLFRKDLNSQYSFHNITISGGGRVALSRVMASLGDIKIGYLVPDYSSYEGLFKSFSLDACPIFLSEEDNFKIDVELIKEEIKKQKLQAILFSNPANPTGNFISGEDLAELIKFARENEILLIIDEFYFNFVYSDKEFISAAEYIEDIETDPVMIISGISKSWRYSGFRIAWTLSSREVASNLSSVGSFLDGGANNPLQVAVEKIVNEDFLRKETKAIQATFRAKRDFMIESLEKLGLEMKSEAGGAFYLWLALDKLPEAIKNSDNFFRACLEEKVIVVPGEFFDLEKEERFKNMIRISYGPNIDELRRGIENIKKVLKKF